MNIILASLLGIISSAQVETTSTENTENVAYPEVQKIDFTGLEVEARAHKPQMKIIHDRNRGQFGFLSELRANFDNEITQTVNDIK